MDRVTVFCGASAGARDCYRHAAAALGRALAGRGLGLVYGGARTGLMGALADSALAAGGDVVGVLPDALIRHEIAHRGLTTLHTVAGMHERKAVMARLGDAFVALPGGFGTAEELFEVVTWSQLGLIAKPVGLLNVDGFFDPLLTWLRHCADEGFVHRRYLDHLIVADEPAGLLDALDRQQPLPNLFAGSPVEVGSA